MPDYNIKANCPDCGYEIDDASGVGTAADQRPEEGDTAVCIACAGVGIYVSNKDGSLGLRKPTEEESEDLATSEELTKVRAIIIGRGVWMKP
jgi:hypothetical protein